VGCGGGVWGVKKISIILLPDHRSGTIWH